MTRICRAFIKEFVWDTKCICIIHNIMNSFAKCIDDHPSYSCKISFRIRGLGSLGTRCVLVYLFACYALKIDHLHQARWGPRAWHTWAGPVMSAGLRAVLLSAGCEVPTTRCSVPPAAFRDPIPEHKLHGLLAQKGRRPAFLVCGTSYSRVPSQCFDTFSKTHYFSTSHIFRNDFWVSADINSE